MASTATQPAIPSHAGVSAKTGTLRMLKDTMFTMIHDGEAFELTHVGGRIHRMPMDRRGSGRPVKIYGLARWKDSAADDCVLCWEEGGVAYAWYLNAHDPLGMATPGANGSIFKNGQLSQNYKWIWQPDSILALVGKPTVAAASCTCDNVALMLHGCPSARGKPCRRGVNPWGR